MTGDSAPDNAVGAEWGRVGATVAGRLRFHRYNAPVHGLLDEGRGRRCEMAVRLCMLWLLGGCGARSIRTSGDGIGPDGDSDADADGDGDTDVDCGEDGSYALEIEQATRDEVDLLVLVDDSGSMREEQAALAASFPDLVAELTAPTDGDGDGVPDAMPASSVHIGVVSSDMGTAGFPVTTCDEADRGNDGVLQNVPSADVEGCDATYPKFLTYDAFAPDANIAQDFACIATLGTGGCAWEQPLYAVEKALTVHAASGAANDGFLRADAVLALLVVTDEDDCSVDDVRMFGGDDSLGPQGLRCSYWPDLVRPVEGFVSSILGVKPGRPDRVVVSAIVGVPTDLVDLGSSIGPGDLQDAGDFEAILDDPRMQEVVDYSAEGNGNVLVASCRDDGGVWADPPRRIVELVSALDREGASGVVQSICQTDWRDAMRAITRNIQGALEGACLSDGLTHANGVPLATHEHADCVVTETLAAGSRCQPGSFEVGQIGERTVCQVCQEGDGSRDFATDFRGNDLSECENAAAFWFYTTEDENCGGRGKIEFNDAAEPPDGAVIRLECAIDAMPEPPGC